MLGDDWFTLAELTQRIGGLVWVEERLAEVLHAWSAVESHAATAVYLAAAGGHHRWHGEVMRGCLPTSSSLLEPDPIRAPTSGWATAIVTLGEFTDPDATHSRLRSLVRVVDPWLERETGALAELARPISDAPMMRWLRFVRIDHHDDADSAVQLLAATSEDMVRLDDHLAVSNIDLS